MNSRPILLTAELASLLTAAGCELHELATVRARARRTSRLGADYALTIELFDAGPDHHGPRRFKARAARRSGLPVVSHHGATAHEALERLDWSVLDRFSLPAPLPAIAELR